jgi:hypothetical protein
MSREWLRERVRLSKAQAPEKPVARGRPAGAGTPAATSPSRQDLSLLTQMRELAVSEASSDKALVNTNKNHYH